ncbi:MAG: DUF1844 domain-containing protein [Deltaproteobacteria bacterium]|nr:DUF1844 domain-containing protein [Deltaproteobacteria bacterium]
MEDKGFKVVDKRLYGTGEGASADVGQASRLSEEQNKDTPQKEEPASSKTHLPPVDFSNLVISLSTYVLIHLGEVPDPATSKQSKNIEMAQHTIDIIEMLKEKTKGNLTESEGKLIDSVLFDLRMRYVNIISDKKTS